MPVINKDFPLSAAARKEHLNEIRKGNSIGSVKVPGHGSLPVYKIPLQFLSYNPYNTRFLSQAKTWEKRLGRRLSDERPEDIEKIEEFLWDYKKDKNENTINSLIREGQLQPGVVTIDGLILAGNRRFRLLNEIDRHPDRYINQNANIDGLRYFEAAILDTVLTEKDVVRYESFYQYGAEDKVDYDPIQKYIAAYQQREEYKFSPKEIAANFNALTNGDERIVQMWLDVYELMADYLTYIGESGIYTSLEGKEESFLNLYKTKSSLERGRTKNASWDYDPMDIGDLQLRYFDYIHIGKSTHDFRIFKDVFLNKSRWTEFNENVQKAVGIAMEEFPTIDDYRSKYPDETEDTISVIRNRDFKDRAEKPLNKLYGTEYAYILSKKEEETPCIIAQQAYQKLEKLESLLNGGLDRGVDGDELLEKVRDLQKLIGKIKMLID